MKSIEFAHTLLEKAHVAVVPAIAYGKSCDSFVRIAFTLEKERIQEGVRRIAAFVRSLV